MISATTQAGPNKVTLWLALTAVYILWGSTYLFIHFMTEHMPPLYMASMRFLTAGTLLYSYARLTGTPRPTRQQLIAGGTLGILMLTVANGCLAVALQFIPTGVAALMNSTFPIFLLTFNWISFGKARPSNMSLAGLILGLAGVYFLIKPDQLQGDSGTQVNWIGITLIVVGNTSWAIGTLLSARMSLPAQVLSSGVQMLAGGVVLLLVSLCMEPVTLTAITVAPPKALGSLVYLVIFGSIIGYSSYAWLARNAPPHLLSTYAYVNPVVALLLGTLFAGEVISGQAMLGAVIVVAGVILITIGRR